MPAMRMLHEIDPRIDLLQQLGDLKDFEVADNQVLCAIYKRPDGGKTSGGIILTHKTVDEDQYQSKVGLIIKVGPKAYDDDYRAKYTDWSILLHDWIVYRASDGWSIGVNGVSCRMIRDTDTKMRIQHPDQVW